MGQQENGTLFDYVELFVQNGMWPLIAVLLLYWLTTSSRVQQQFSKIVIPGHLEIEFRELKQKLEETRDEVHSLVNELDREREIFGEILVGLDPQVQAGELGEVRELLRAQGAQLDDVESLKAFLSTEATAAQIFGAAVILRERRPTKLFGSVVSYLDKISNNAQLGGVRLNTVWTLVSALHRMLIASFRDGVNPQIKREELLIAKDVLNRLARNPKVLQDRTDNPDKGVRGPIRHSLAWIERGLDNS